MTTTTLNPVDKYVDIVLSNGNLTATYTPAPGGQGSSGPTSGNRNVRATQSGTAGRYFEVTFSQIATGTGTPGVGLANSSQSLSAYPGNPNGVGWFASNYAEWPGSGFSGNFTPSPLAMCSVFYSKHQTPSSIKTASLSAQPRRCRRERCIPLSRWLTPRMRPRPISARRQWRSCLLAQPAGTERKQRHRLPPQPA
jgi:hypothetical protein